MLIIRVRHPKKRKICVQDTGLEEHWIDQKIQLVLGRLKEEVTKGISMGMKVEAYDKVLGHYSKRNGNLLRL